MAAIRSASTTWDGDLAHGKGQITATTSTALNSLPVTWASRIEKADGRTSPEELVAAAHATCYSMALSHILGTSKTPPQHLEVEAVVTFAQAGDGFKVESSALTVQGVVPGIDAAAFTQAAEAAKENCPISLALKGNVELSVKATLKS